MSLLDKLKNKEQIRIDDLQRERISILEKLKKEGSYTDPRHRTADVEKLKAIKRELNEWYIRKNGL